MNYENIEFLEIEMISFPFVIKINENLISLTYSAIQMKIERK